MNNLSASIVLASYNGERYIYKQLYSILIQMRFEDEIIIIDDCSKDETVNLIKGLFKKFNKLNSSLYINKKNLGPKKSFEKGLKKVTKNITVLSDQDDIWIEGRLSKIKKSLKNYDFCTLNSYILENDNIKICSEFTFNLVKPSKSIIKNIIKPSFIGCHIAFKSSYLKYILPFPNLVYMHDMYIGIFALLSGSLFIDNNPSMYYRRHLNCYTPKNTDLLFKILIRVRYLMTIIFVKILLFKSK